MRESQKVKGVKGPSKVLRRGFGIWVYEGGASFGELDLKAHNVSRFLWIPHLRLSPKPQTLSLLRLYGSKLCNGINPKL